jgi:preprotein translocase subunit YajC
MSNVILIAQDAPPAAPKQENPLGLLGNPLLMIALMALFFFVVMWPAQRRQRREQQAMLASIKPGVKVVTASGIVGSVVKAKEGEDEIVLKSEDTKLRVLRSTIARVLGTEEATEAK